MATGLTPELVPPGIVQTVVSGHTFSIATKYDMSASKILGLGSYGVVATTVDTEHDSRVVAVKRIRPYAFDVWSARHTLREVRLLKLLSPHPNVISVYDLALFDPKMELYMVMEVR
jgi:serine/threonine protein kinase